MGRRIAPTMGYAHAGWLIRSERQQEEDTQQALDNLGLKPGMTVCDLGCGNGYYSLEIAGRILPGGRVLAVDIQQEMLHLLQLRAQEAKIDNIETILGGVADPQLPEGSVDLLLLVDVYHEFSHPQQMLAAIRESLAPEGRVALVEFRAEDPRVPILPLHKMSKRQILREFKANGFKLVEEYDQLPWQHLMFFQAE
jgi:ubiquinone/menaquinone biosynthesis C-methylase UbiE